jgi:hypothetical protein
MDAGDSGKRPLRLAVDASDVRRINLGSFMAQAELAMVDCGWVRQLNCWLFIVGSRNAALCSVSHQCEQKSLIFIPSTLS